MTSPFEEIARAETAKKEIRAAIELLIDDVRYRLTATDIIYALMQQAYASFFSIHGQRGNGRWTGPAIVSLQRIRDGTIRTKEAALREIGDRNLTANTYNQLEATDIDQGEA